MIWRILGKIYPMKQLFTLLGFFIICTASAQYDLVYKLEKDGVYPQKQTVISEQKQVINGFPQEVTTVITTDADYIVRDIIDGVYHIDIVIKKMSNESKSAMGTESMSSEGPASNRMNTLFKNMSNKPIKVTMDQYGKLLSINVDAQLSGLMDGVEMPEMQKLSVESAMKAEMTAEKQKVSYEMLTAIFPTQNVNVSDTWNQSLTINSVGNFDTIAINKLESVTDKTYVISSTADVKTPEDNTTNLNGMDAIINLSGPRTATYTINRATGWITEAVINQSLNGDITIKANANIPEDMKMSMETVTTSRMDGRK